MRKLLLASAAMLGLVAGTAQAATFDQTDAKRNSSAFGAPQTNPDPGKIIVRLGGLIDIDGGIVGSTVDRGQTGTPNAGAKNQPYGLSGYFRLYFGVDGKLANGIIYGGNAEMRTNFAGGQPPGYTGTGTIGNGSANSTASTWYTRRAYGYIGGAQWGIFRIGQGDGPLSLFTGGGITTGEAFSTGAWDGDVPDFFGNGALAWPFLDVGNEYTDNKITYVSPNIAGFNIGASFAPSSAVLEGNSGSGTNAASGGFDRQSASTLGSDLGRPRNLYEIAARWQGPLGPVTIDAMLGYLGSGNVTNASTLTPGKKFQPLSVIDGGASVTFAGASVFGHVSTGQMNGAATPRPVIVGRSKNGFAWVAGAQYSIGAWTAGASYFVFESEGSAGGFGNRMERGLAVGGFYTVTPGFDVFLEYLYGTRYQRGVNFIDPAGAATTGNRVQSQGIASTLLIRW
jgi:predicted porin